MAALAARRGGGYRTVPVLAPLRRVRRKIRMQGKHPLLDWAEAIGSAILIVLVINQFLLQAYRIPSESMVPTLLVGDRIFVNKLILPGPNWYPDR